MTPQTQLLIQSAIWGIGIVFAIVYIPLDILTKAKHKY